MPYPNPATSNLTIDFDDAQMAQDLLEEISLCNQKGATLKKFNVDDAKKEKYFLQTKSVVFDIHDLPSGIYFLHIRMGDKLYEDQIAIE